MDKLLMKLKNFRHCVDVLQSRQIHLAEKIVNNIFNFPGITKCPLSSNIVYVFMSWCLYGVSHYFQ